MKKLHIASLLALPAVATGQSFNLDFGPGSATAGTGPPSALYGAASGSVGTWNWIDGDALVGLTDFTSPPLLDLGGAATAATVRLYDPTGTAFGFNSLGFDEPSTTGDDALLMDDIIYMGDWVIEFAGLAPGNYDVYTYGMAPDSPAYFTGIDVPAGTGGYQAVGGDFSLGVHTLGITYAMHSVTVDGSGMLAVNISVDDTFDSINGIQIVSGGGGSIGTNYCGPANPHSGGLSGVISAMGSLAVADNNVTLTASDLPVGQFGMFVNSMTQGFITPPGSAGNLCVVGQIGRHNANIMNSGAGGTFSLALDLNSVPTPLGPVAINPGETWNFQTWFRDLGGTSNFTDAIELPFN